VSRDQGGLGDEGRQGDEVEETQQDDRAAVRRPPPSVATIERVHQQQDGKHRHQAREAVRSSLSRVPGRVRHRAQQQARHHADQW
jgi:hypothetical protein